MRGLLAALSCFLFFLAFHAVIFHGWEIHRRARSLVTIGLGTVLFYVLGYSLLPEDSAYLPMAWSAPSDVITFINGLVIYFFLFLGYCQFFYMAESSVGVRTLIELERSQTRGLKVSDLLQGYSYDWMLDRRLARLVDESFLIMEAGGYRNTRKGRMLAGILQWCKEFLRLGPGG